MQKVILAVWTLSLNLSFLDKAKPVKVLKNSMVHTDFVSLPLFWYQICCHIEIFHKCTHLKISSSLSYNIIFILIPLWRSTKMFCFALFFESKQHQHGKWSVSPSVMSDSLSSHSREPAMLFCLWNSPGKNTGVGSHSHLQRIFPNQGLNLGLLHGRKIFEPVNLGTKESYNAYVVLSVNKIPINVRYNNTSLQS